MAPTLTAVRHAQGYHNLSIANHQLHDPKLTPVGEEQCRILSETFPDMKNVDLVVASPIKRTIYTALMTFEEVLRTKNLKVICLPELQETSDLPCDTGSSPEELAKEFEGMPVDLELVKPGWNVKRLKWAPTATAIQKRARDARVWLMARPEKNVVLVSHGLYKYPLQRPGWKGDMRLKHGTDTHQVDSSITLPKTGRVAIASRAQDGPTPSTAATTSVDSNPTKRTCSKPQSPSTVASGTRSRSITTRLHSSSACLPPSGRSRRKNVRRRAARRAMSWRSRRRYKIIRDGIACPAMAVETGY